MSAIEKMLPKCLTNYTHLLPEIVHNSGRTIISRGHYEDCLDNPDLKYSFLSYQAYGQPVPYHGGFCLPRACPDTIFTKYLNETLAMMNSPLTVESVNSDTQNYSYPVFWLTYLTIALIVLFVSLTIYATVVGWLQKRRGKQQQISFTTSAFDMGRNMKHFQVRPNQPLNIMDGVRALAMMWVVIGHSFGTYTSMGIVNILNVLEIVKHPFYLLLTCAPLSVDVFFMLGGFFLAFIMLRQKSQGFKYLLAVPQRALRIWPAYILCMMFFYSLMLHTGNGAAKQIFEPVIQNCQHMWRDTLFIANYFTRSEMCMGWGWYLQVDFQLFVFGLITLYLYKKSAKAAYGLIILTIIGSLAYNIEYTYHYENHIMADFGHTNKGNSGIDLYIKPWARCPPYLVGLAFGMMFMEHRRLTKQGKKGVQVGFLGALKDKFNTSRIVRCLVEWSGIVIMSFFAFFPRTIQTGQKWPQLAHSLYASFDKPVFVFAIILTILPTTLGVKGSFFNSILTNKAFTFIARISFCTYLVHIFIIAQSVVVVNSDEYFNTITVFMTYLGWLVLSLFFGFLLTMTVELPFANLQKKYVQKILKASKPRNQENSVKESLITKVESGSSLGQEMSKADKQ